MKLTLVLGVLVVALLAYVRLAPSDPARWHVDPETASEPGAGGVLLHHPVAAPANEALARFDAIASASPRIRVLAGSVDEGLVTYIVRSQWVGFPDYVTVKAVPDGDKSVLILLSRLRFGVSDLGVNRARLDRWLQRLDTAQN